MSGSQINRRKRLRSTNHPEPECENDFIFEKEDSDNSDSDCGSEDFGNDENSDWLVHLTDIIPKTSYEKTLEQYTDDQKKLEPNHTYEWVDGEKRIDEIPTDEFLLPESTKKQIRNASFTEVFEYFFSTELKNYIIESTNLNGYELTMDDLNAFVGIIIISILNSRKSQKDYWSSDPLLACPPVTAAMSRNKFYQIKSKIKLSKPTDESPTDRIWRVRGPYEIFRKNIKRFGYFSTALSVDETMIKYYGRTILKQYLKDKPDEWGIKQWSLCNREGYLFDCDVYCGKGSNPFSQRNSDTLTKCGLGSRVVLQLAQGLLAAVSSRKITKYTLYFDNYFSSPDLLVHLLKIGIRATGTVRADRVKDVSNDIEKKAQRGSYKVKHDKNSGLNYVTIMDSKPVSIISTAAGVSPLASMQRYSKAENQKVKLPFPSAFSIYNKYMGGVDQHDFHCSMLKPSIRAKKWTWVILLRLIQASLTNATVLKNMVSPDNKRVGTKDVALDVTRKYLVKSPPKVVEIHESVVEEKKRNCSNFSRCATRTQRLCSVCKIYLCSSCFSSVHQI